MGRPITDTPIRTATEATENRPSYRGCRFVSRHTAIVSANAQQLDRQREHVDPFHFA